jgi:hypothetical protein
VSITSPQSVPPTRAPDGEAPPVEPGVSDLRRTRLGVAAELSHCRYMIRLVRARTDLLVAAALGPLDDLPAWITGTDIARLVLDIPCDGVGQRLEALTAASRRLAALEARLDGRLDDVTDSLVQALRADPRAALRAASRL